MKVGPDAGRTGGASLATFGGGCFWCTEAVFKELAGVVSVVPGYAGGTVANPTYEQVCTGTTGHTEAVQVMFDPVRVDYAALLEIFWKTHDPTTRDRSAADGGMQYRSAVFHHDEAQRALAQEYLGKLEASGAFGAPIQTDIVPFTVFYPAEDYHRDYFANHPENPYCATVIGPKLEKMRKVFSSRLK